MIILTDSLILSFQLSFFSINSVVSSDSIFLRTIPGLKAVEEAVGRSTEMGRPILYVPGIMDMNEVETVAGVIILGHVAQMTAQYETGLDVPVARSIVMQAARESCKEAYLRFALSNEPVVREIGVHTIANEASETRQKVTLELFQT